MLLFVDTVNIIFIVLGIALALAVLVMLGIKWYIFEYNRYAKRKKVDLPISASELARANLDRAGLTDVEVVIKTFKSGYSFRRKKLYITKRMERKATAYSVSRVMQLVSLAMILDTDEQARKKSSNIKFMNYGATALFFVMILVSIVVESTTSGAASLITLIVLVLSLGFYVFTTIYSIKYGFLIKRANADAMGYIKNMEIFDEKDLNRINKIYNLSVKEYNINTLLSVLYVIYYGLKVIGVVLNIFGKRR